VNAAIFRKTLREALPLALVLTAAILAFETLFVRAIGEFANDISQVLLAKIGIRRLVQGLVGADLAENMTSTGLITVGFAHPLVYAFTWIFIVTTCSRVIAGEVERGTADLLLTLPVSRGSIFASISLAWVLCGVPLSMAPWIGVWLGERVSPLWEPLELARLAPLVGNLFALYLAIGAATLLASSIAARRGPVIAIILTGLLGSFLLNFLAQIWPAVHRIAVLGILNYYQPLPVARTGAWPVRNLVVLLTCAGVAWVLGLWQFRRRDIRA
jgi:ABC-2 type transport system permease protein